MYSNAITTTEKRCAFHQNTNYRDNFNHMDSLACEITQGDKKFNSKIYEYYVLQLKML